MSSKGFLFLNVGTKYTDRIQVAVGSLRDFHDEPIRIMTDSFDNPGTLQCVKRFKDVEAKIVDVPKIRNGAYLFKSTMGRHGFDETIFLDADTLTVGSLAELWPGDRIKLTAFSNWDTSGGIISGRVRLWQKVAPDLVANALSKPWPAVNTGSMGFSKGHPFMDAWEKLTGQNVIHICDEVAAQILYPDFAVDIMSDKFNLSPKFGIATDDPRCWHGHGNKTQFGPMKEPWERKAKQLGIKI